MSMIKVKRKKPTTVCLHDGDRSHAAIFFVFTIFSLIIIAYNWFYILSHFEFELP